MLCWLQHRVIPKNRAFVHEILQTIGLSINDTKGIIDVCKGLSLNDSYWIVPENFDGRFADFNLYENRFSQTLSLVAYTGAGTGNDSGAWHQCHPRRFGKTLNMSMINCFFSYIYRNRGELFDGLKVWEDADLREQQGKWPVIFLSFANVKQTKWEEARKVLNEKLMGARNAFRHIMNDPMFTDEDREYFYAIKKDMDDATMWKT